MHFLRGRVAAVLALAALLGLPGCASTLKVKVGWDQKAAFSKYKTWAWKADGSIQDAVWAKRCQDVLSDELAKHGLTQVDLSANPDLWAVVHARLTAQTQIASVPSMWGYGWGAWAPVDTFEYQIPVGTIVIDLVDVRAKEAVWQGKATDAIATGKTNEEREEKLIAILAEMFAGYPPAAGTAPAR